MNKELKAKWVAGLLSEDYEQGRALLHGDGKFCCLGVLRHINNPDDITKRTNFCGEESELLSRERQNEFGLTLLIQDELSFMNDHGVPFPMIAGFIQENL